MWNEILGHIGRRAAKLTPERVADVALMVALIATISVLAR